MIGQCMAREPPARITRCVRWTPEDADMSTILIFGAIAVIGVGLVISQISSLRDWLKRPRRPDRHE
jgi:hypothetical protein